jgi:hypothetical protein
LRERVVVPGQNLNLEGGGRLAVIGSAGVQDVCEMPAVD